VTKCLLLDTTKRTATGARIREPAVQGLEGPRTRKKASRTPIEKCGKGTKKGKRKKPFHTTMQRGVEGKEKERKANTRTGG